MYESITVLGRQPKLGIAELESLYGAKNVQPYGEAACFINKPSDAIEFSRLGGSVRLCKVLTELPNNWQAIETYLLKTTPEHASSVSGKLSFGLSVFGMNIPPKKVAQTALKVKKAIKNAGHSVRMVPHNDKALGSATVLYNKLTAQNGWELCIIADKTRVILAQTAAIQDIDAYAARDQARPMRDAKVGMLPPKLAQIIINLAVGQIVHSEGGKNLSTQSSELRTRILDPFCGTGVLLQEAMLMNYDILGTDIEPRMVQYTIDNLAWLDTKFPDSGDYRRIELGDAMTHRWYEPGKITAVAAETFLGQPLSTLPPSDQLRKIMQEANEINHKFLLNISKQLTSGTRLCLGIPTWRGKHEFLHLPLLAHLTEMGYNRVKFKHVDNQDLIYHREGQVVGRELLVLEKQ